MGKMAAEKGCEWMGMREETTIFEIFF